MSHTINSYRALAAAVGISAALCLSACGGSSKPKSQAASHTSTAATQASSAATSSATTTTTHSLSPAALGRAHRAMFTSFAACLRKHGIHVPPQKWSGPNPTFNTTGIKTSTPRYQKIGAACLSSAAAAYSSATAEGR